VSDQTSLAQHPQVVRDVGLPGTVRSTMAGALPSSASSSTIQARQVQANQPPGAADVSMS
jgi:hypothetical protein